MGRWLTGSWLGWLFSRNLRAEAGTGAAPVWCETDALAQVEIIRVPCSTLTAVPVAPPVAAAAPTQMPVSASRPLAAMLASQARMNVPASRSSRAKAVARQEAPKKTPAPRSVHLQARRTVEKHVVRRSADVVALPLKRPATGSLTVRSSRVAA